MTTEREAGAVRILDLIRTRRKAKGNYKRVGAGHPRATSCVELEVDSMETQRGE